MGSSRCNRRLVAAIRGWRKGFDRWVFGRSHIVEISADRNLKNPSKFLSKSNLYPTPVISTSSNPRVFKALGHKGLLEEEKEDIGIDQNLILVKRGILVALVCGVLIFGCRRVFAVEGVVNAGYGVIGQCILLLRNTWPKASMILKVFKEQGVVLTALLSLSAFFSMVCELAEKDSEDDVFKMLSSDVTRFLTTILIGTTVVNIGATALVTDAATTMFGEAGVNAATGVMTVCCHFASHEITPKSIAVHNPTEVARFVVRPMAWLSVILYPVGRVVTYLSMGMLKILGIKGKSEPYVTEDELKLMLRGAELSEAIEEVEQDMIENVLEIKDTHVREVMTPLVDVVAIDTSSTLVKFHNLWLTHQYSSLMQKQKCQTQMPQSAWYEDESELEKKVFGEEGKGEKAVDVKTWRS
ncbi:putative DUF21 domain-containing protein At3g13070, chloroplastic [Hibiscus syriacus]|uniref:putative DUF21 domain-containing protein At3g13070, chloroplastic n=1 Tax=Hibiscus syriacus TaxID=106335 RepID=UPI0019205CF1|nr:putative DUF21 domain-containing protein At3g13070, chloroplastic [Hibiscus syriacus]